jgi:hypothetical protein
MYAMCAIDALGIAKMLGTDLRIQSTDPHTGYQPIDDRRSPGQVDLCNFLEPRRPRARLSLIVGRFTGPSDR